MNDNSAKTYSLKISSEERNAIESSFYDHRIDNSNQYIDFFAKYSNVSISIYKPNKKGEIVVVFQGSDALKAINSFPFLIQRVETKEKKGSLTKETIKNFYPQIGSDEVGTGDFFGPICVCAAFVKESDLPLLNELGITDSKKMKDDYILSIGPTLIKNFEYSQLSLPNEKFNQISSEINMNAIKAKMHNRCLLNLYEKHSNVTVYQDQFAEPKLYFSYLKAEEKVLTKVIFHTKGETLFPSVALASVIARYSFLKKMQKMDEEYEMHFPFGVNQDVNDLIPVFINKYGEKELAKVAKLKWANYQKLNK